MDSQFLYDVLHLIGNEKVYNVDVCRRVRLLLRVDAFLLVFASLIQHCLLIIILPSRLNECNGERKSVLQRDITRDQNKLLVSVDS